MILGRYGGSQVAFGQRYPARRLASLGVTAQLHQPALRVLLEAVDVGAPAALVARRARRPPQLLIRAQQWADLILSRQWGEIKYFSGNGGFIGEMMFQVY